MVFGLNITIEDKENKKIIHLEGRLDATTTPILENKMKALLELKKQLVLINFSKIEYLSSAGMRLLLSSTKKISAQGGKLVFCGLNGEVMEIIKMAGFERILAIYSNESDALKALQS